MSPIFKNIVIDSSKKDVIGEHMFNYCQSNKIPLHKSKKLIGSMFGEKILLYTPLLKWYLAAMRPKPEFQFPKKRWKRKKRKIKEKEKIEKFFLRNCEGGKRSKKNSA